MTYQPHPTWVWGGDLEPAPRLHIEVYEPEPQEAGRPLLLDASGNWLPRVSDKPTNRRRIGFLPWGPEED